MRVSLLRNRCEKNRREMIVSFTLDSRLTAHGGQLAFMRSLGHIFFAFGHERRAGGEGLQSRIRWIAVAL